MDFFFPFPPLLLIILISMPFLNPYSTLEVMLIHTVALCTVLCHFFPAVFTVTYDYYCYCFSHHFSYLPSLSKQQILLHSIPTALLFVFTRATVFPLTLTRIVACCFARERFLLLFPTPVLSFSVSSHTPFQCKDAPNSMTPIIIICKGLFSGLSRHSHFHTCPTLWVWKISRKQQRHEAEETHCRLANN